VAGVEKYCSLGAAVSGAEKWRRLSSSYKLYKDEKAWPERESSSGVKAEEEEIL